MSAVKKLQDLTAFYEAEKNPDEFKQLQEERMELDVTLQEERMDESMLKSTLKKTVGRIRDIEGRLIDVNYKLREYARTPYSTHKAYFNKK